MPTDQPHNLALADEIEAAIVAYHDAMPQAQGEQGDPFAAKEAAKALSRLLYNHSDRILAALRTDRQAVEVGVTQADDYEALALSHLQSEIGHIDDKFPNYGDWPITLPAGHWHAILTALRTTSTSALAGWQPIETAPKDEYATFYVTERIIGSLWNCEVVRRIGGEIVKAWDHKPFAQHEASWTHWRPLPEPPVLHREGTEQ